MTINLHYAGKTSCVLFLTCNKNLHLVVLKCPFTAIFPLSPSFPLQDFNPDDFLSQTLGVEEGSDQAKSQIAGLMASSHVPYILNRLNMSISSNDSTGLRSLLGVEIEH